MLLGRFPNSISRDLFSLIGLNMYLTFDVGGSNALFIILEASAPIRTQRSSII